MSIPRIHIFSDFDGTITLQDTTCVILDDPRCMGAKRRKELDQKLLEGTTTLKEVMEEEWNTVSLTWEEAWELLKDIKHDDGFSSFYRYCKKSGIPVTIVSSGMKFIISKLMYGYLGDMASEIEIVSNNVVVEDRRWEVTFYDDSSHGHDKSRTLSQARISSSPDTIVIFCGDGVSDISASAHADLLFARKGKDLEKYCLKKGITFESFENFEDVENIVRKLVERKIEIVDRKLVNLESILRANNI